MQRKLISFAVHGMAAALVATNCVPAVAGLVASYSTGSGATALSPVAVYGWNAFGISGPTDVQGRSVVDASAGAPVAWQVTDAAVNGTLPQYYQSLQGTALTNARNRGWSMTTTARLVNEQEGPPTMGIGVYFDTAAYLLMIDRDPASNQLLAYLPDTNTGQTRVHTLASGAAAYNYYDYELRYSPQTREVSFYFNGALFDIWDGVPSSHSASENIFQFGSASFGGSGRMNFRSVAFSTIDTPVQQGDFNNDGAIDAADYTLWRDNRGLANASADANGDGIVSRPDFVAWRNNFGRPTLAALGVGTGGVPEPTGACIVAGTLCLSAAFRAFRGGR